MSAVCGLLKIQISKKKRINLVFFLGYNVTRVPAKLKTNPRRALIFLLGIVVFLFLLLFASLKRERASVNYVTQNSIFKLEEERSSEIVDTYFKS